MQFHKETPVKKQHFKANLTNGKKLHQQDHQTCSRNFKPSVSPKRNKAKDIRTNSANSLMISKPPLMPPKNDHDRLKVYTIRQCGRGRCSLITIRLFPIPQQSYSLNTIFGGANNISCTKKNPIISTNIM